MRPLSLVKSITPSSLSPTSSRRDLFTARSADSASENTLHDLAVDAPGPPRPAKTVGHNRDKKVFIVYFIKFTDDCVASLPGRHAIAFAIIDDFLSSASICRREMLLARVFGGHDEF